MSSSFGKIYSSVTESSLWEEAYPTRLVFITMLCKCDALGRVMASVPGLARLAAVQREECEFALDRLQAPDPDSRTLDFDGRRIQKIDGGWLVLNYTKYRNLRDEEVRREQNRIAQQRTRERKRSATVLTPVDESSESAQAEAEEDAKNTITSELHWPKRLTDAEVVVIAQKIERLGSALQQQVLDEYEGRMRLPKPPDQPMAWLDGTIKKAFAGEFVPDAGLAVAKERARRAAEQDQLRKQAEERRRKEESRNDPEVQARSKMAREKVFAMFNEESNLKKENE